MLEETCESGTSACVFTVGTQCLMLRDLNDADGALKAGTLAVSCLGVKVIAGRSAGVVSWKSWRGKNVQQGMQRNSEHYIKKKLRLTFFFFFWKFMKSRLAAYLIQLRL